MTTTTPTPVVTAGEALAALDDMNQPLGCVTAERCQKIRSALLRLQQLEQKASVEALAAIIRHVDGNHSLGAAALAEAILAHPSSCWQPAALPEQP